MALYVLSHCCLSIVRLLMYLSRHLSVLSHCYMSLSHYMSFPIITFLSPHYQTIVPQPYVCIIHVTFALMYSSSHLTVLVIVPCHCHITYHRIYCHIVVYPWSDCCTTNFMSVWNMLRSHSFEHIITSFHVTVILHVIVHSITLLFHGQTVVQGILHLWNMLHSHSLTWVIIQAYHHIVTCHCHITCHSAYYHILVFPLSHCCTTTLHQYHTCYIHTHVLELLLLFHVIVTLHVTVRIVT